MKKLILLLVAFVCLGLVMKAQNFINQSINFDDNLTPAGWQLTKTSNSGISNGKLNSSVTDGYSYISWRGKMPSVIDSVVAEWDGTVLYSAWHGGTEFMITSKDTIYDFGLGYGNIFPNKIRATLATRDSANTQTKAIISDNFATNVAGDYHNIVSITDKYFYFKVIRNSDNAVIFDLKNLKPNDINFKISEIRRFMFFTHSTTDNSNWVDNINIQLFDKYANNTLSFDNQTTKVGQQIEMPIKTTELIAIDNIISYQFDYNYDNTKLEYVGNTLIGTLADGGSIQVNPTSGKLSIAWARGTALIGIGAIIKLQFKSIDVGTTTPTITNAFFNTKPVNLIINGTITSTIKYGDIDVNGFVQAYDAALAIQYSIGLDPLPIADPLPWETWRIKVANVDGTAGVTANDASLILKYTVGLINVFPVGKKRGTSDNAEVNLKIENGNITFRSSGDLFGLNVFVNENKNLLGTPQILNQSMLSATNISATTYAIGLATPNAPKEGEMFMKIPFTAGQSANITFDMIVNDTRKQVTIGLATGIVEINDKTISVFPNPANDILYINGLTQNTKVSIYDLFGKMVFNKQINNNQIELNGFQSGVYSIKMENSKGIVTRKFVKQ
jgi:hypothetical protein